MINVIITGLIGIFGVLLGSFLSWFLYKKEREKKDEWNFFLEATTETMATINLIDTKVIQYNLQEVISRFFNLLHKLNKIKYILSIKYDEKTKNTFFNFYEATLAFTEDLRKQKDEVNLEGLESYKVFQEKKETWLELVKERLKIKQ